MYFVEHVRYWVTVDITWRRANGGPQNQNSGPQNWLSCTKKNSSNGPSDLSGKTLANLINSQCNWLLFLVIPFQPWERGLKKWWNKQSCSIGCTKSSKATKLAFIPGLEYDQHDWQMTGTPSFRGSAMSYKTES